MYKYLLSFLVITLCYLHVTISVEAITQTGTIGITAQVISNTIPPGIGGSGGSDTTGNSVATVITVSGTTTASAYVYISIGGVIVAETTSDSNGFFSVTINNVETGNQTLEIQSVDPNGIRIPKVYLPIRVTDHTAITINNISLQPMVISDQVENFKPDLNKDGVVTSADFSLLAFWYNKKGFPIAYDLNSDSTITMADFSIMAFYWNE